MIFRKVIRAVEDAMFYSQLLPSYIEWELYPHFAINMNICMGKHMALFRGFQIMTLQRCLEKASSLSLVQRLCPSYAASYNENFVLCYTSELWHGHI